MISLTKRKSAITPSLLIAWPAGSSILTFLEIQRGFIAIVRRILCECFPHSLARRWTHPGFIINQKSCKQSSCLLKRWFYWWENKRRFAAEQKRGVSIVDSFRSPKQSLRGHQGWWSNEFKLEMMLLHNDDVFTEKFGGELISQQVVITIHETKEFILGATHHYTLMPPHLRITIGGSVFLLCIGIRYPYSFMVALTIFLKRKNNIEYATAEKKQQQHEGRSRLFTFPPWKKEQSHSILHFPSIA